MAWLLKQAEDILNRVDQQANVALHQHSTTGSSSIEQQHTTLPDSTSLATNIPSNKPSLSTRGATKTTGTIRNKKNDVSNLIDYLNSPAPSSSSETKKPTRNVQPSNVLSDTARTASSPNMLADEQFGTSEESLSKSASGTPRPMTPASAHRPHNDSGNHDDDEGLVWNIVPTATSAQETTVDDKHHTDVEQQQQQQQKHSRSNTIDSVTMKDELLASLHAEIESLSREKRDQELDLQTYKRQQLQHQQQIAECDALLRDLRSREADSVEALGAKDSQIALLRVRLAESDDLARSKTILCEQLQNQCSRILQDHSDSSGIQSQAFDSVQMRVAQLEHELNVRTHDYERAIEERRAIEKRASDERQQLLDQLKLAEKRIHDERTQMHEQQQQAKHAKNLVHQLEQDMNEYKAKAQRILQTKEKLITKLKEIAQHRASTPMIGDQQEAELVGITDDPTLLDVSLVGSSSISSSSMPANWAYVQYEELKSENEMFKQELQARELTIHTLRGELQEAELLIQHAEEQLHEQTNQLNEQLKDERTRLTLAEQDCRKMKQELAYIHEESHRQKQSQLSQLAERERELERLRFQLTAKTINHVNDDELEKRLQTLTESLIHKQTIIETLQTDKSSLTMQLERLEKRLDDYETIAPANGSQQSGKRLQTSSNTTLQMGIDNNDMYENEHLENVRYRMPLLRETPYDVDLAKKVKRAANELDRLGIRLGVFLRRYPVVRLGFLFYAILLHLWTLIVLFTYKPEIHGNIHSIDITHKP